MTTATTPSLALPFDRVKMDERKRSLAPDADDQAPRSKRVKEENGTAPRMSAENEAHVEAFQKEAIMRQMNEYKRQAKHYQTLHNDLNKKLANHDDHLRATDAWFSQLLDEVRVLAATALPDTHSESGGELYNSALEFGDNETFSNHLHSRSKKIKEAITDIFSRLPAASPEAQGLQSQIAAALAKEKATLAECQRLISEKEQLTERLETASYRYLKAEKMVERAKSQTVQKLERQAIMGGNGESSSPTVGRSAATPQREHSETNGDLPNGVSSGESETARKEAIAAAEKRKRQLEEVEVENDRLTNELSAARTKVASLSDDDYAGTALFKTFKSQHEDVIKRVNDLEATNVQLREEAQRMQAERTSYRRQVDEESRAQTTETESQIARCEVDLARIRNSRDELNSELAIRKGAEENRRVSSDQAKELVTARDQRITALEAEVERLRIQLGEEVPADDKMDEQLDVDSLQTKYKTLQNQYKLISQELPAIEAAYNKTQALASKKIIDVAANEEMVSRLNAEKAKAEQKYFAAMKLKDAKEQELRILKQQNSRSSEIVSQLKDADGKTRELVVSLERQIAEAKEGSSKLEQSYRSAEQKHKEASTMTEGLKKQVEELKTVVLTKDKEALEAAKARREAEDTLEQLRVRLEDTKTALETLRRSRAAVADSSGSDEWRSIAICPICKVNIRNTVLKLCGHVLCNACVKDLMTHRSRRCPVCSKSFGTNDSMAIALT